MNCGQCGGTVGDSPSDDFCSERCQWLWRWERSGCADPELIARGRSLDDQVIVMLNRQCPASPPR